MKKAFTLIELLIVIALLGALAVGLLAALDPFEQLKKGTDTGVRNTVSEVHGATIRYYAIKNQMPWCSDANCTTWADAGILAETLPSNPPLNLTALTNTLQNIITTGELKADFSTLAGSATLAKIIVFGSNTSAAVQVCYRPTSKSFISDPNTKFDPLTGLEVAGAGAALCIGQGSGGAKADCVWCVK